MEMVQIQYGNRCGQITRLRLLFFPLTPLCSSFASFLLSALVPTARCLNSVMMLALRAPYSRHFCRTPQLKATGIARLARQSHSFAQSKFFQVSEEVRDAVATGKPVVALESTIYTHGMYALNSSIKRPM